jgi:hypothetical protein
MKACLNVYKFEEIRNYSSNNNKNYPTLLYYYEETNLYEFHKITNLLDKTTKLKSTSLYIKKFADYSTTINEIEKLLELYYDNTNNKNTKWTSILKSLKLKINPNQLLYFQTQIKN